MSELRQNLATKDWVIVAPERGQRPHLFAGGVARPLTEMLAEREEGCPFCPGNESTTPKSLIQWPENGPWRLRVVANRFPALDPDTEHDPCLSGLKRRVSGVGYHEVVIETPRHNVCPALQTPQEIRMTLRAFQERGRRMLRDPHIEHVIYFRNHGPAAGTSIVHPHSQMLGLPMIPQETRHRIEEARRAVDDRGSCAYCTMVAMELAERERVVAENRFFVAFVPYAAATPFNVWIVPRLHRPSFLAIGEDELGALAALMRDILGRLYHGLRDPDYNYIVCSAPRRDIASDYLHWYVTVIPRVTKSAGFELGTGMTINPVLPEENAAFLREANPGSPPGGADAGAG
jgi:UDPglucose--hexose-1-phosphate uridylyltransferase